MATAKGIGSSPRGAVTNAVATGIATLVVTGAAALAAVLLAHKFGRTARTDGFLAAYAVYLLLGLAGQSARVVVTPQLARAARAGAIGGETAAYAASVAAFALPLLVVAALASGPIAHALTSGLPHAADAAASGALPWLVAAAVLQFYAALLAAALAAFDDYVTPALGSAVAAVVGVIVFLFLADAHGPVSLAWGLAGGGVLALVLPLGRLLGKELGSPRFASLAARRRIGELWRGAALPLALQALFLIAIHFAAQLGVGKVSALSYAFFVAAFLVAATASSLALVSSVPLTRERLEGQRAVRHILNLYWISLPVIAGAAGIAALAGQAASERVLGAAFSGGAGDELTRLIVYLTPWIVMSVGVSVTFPLVFVWGNARALPLVGLVALALHVPVEWAAQRWLGLAGLAAGLAVTTGFVFAALLAALSRETLWGVVRGIGWPAAVSVTAAVACFGAASVLTDGMPAAAAGLCGYLALFALVRPRPLRTAWGYVRALQ